MLLLVLLLLVVPGARAQNLAPADVAFDALLDRLVSKVGAGPAHLRFTQTVDVLGFSLEGSGQAWLRPPSHSRTDFALDSPIGPIRSRVVVTPEAVWQETESPAGRKTYKYPPTDTEGALALDPFAALGGLQADALRDFIHSRYKPSVLGIDRAASPPVYVVELVSLFDGPGTPVGSRVRVTLGTDDAFPRRLEIKDPEGAAIGAIAFTDLRFGAAIPDSVFAYVPPAGFTVVDVAAERRSAPSRRPAADGWEGRPAPGFVLPSLAGKQVDLGHYEGRWVLIDFWASWCGPCVRAMPHLQRLHDTLPGLTVLAVNLETAGEADRFIKARGYTFATLIDDTKDVARRYGVSSIPTSFLVSPDGTVTRRFVGYHGEAQLRSALEAAGVPAH